MAPKTHKQASETTTSTAETRTVTADAATATTSTLPEPNPEQVAVTRRLPPVQPEHIPAVSDDFRPLEGSVMQGLIKPADDQRAEIREALFEIFTKGDQLAIDLGALVPDFRHAEIYYRAMPQSEEADRRAALLASFASDFAAILVSDIMGFLMSVRDELDHTAKKKPAVVAKYPAVTKLFQQRSAKMTEGKARKQAEKEQLAEAAAAAKK